MQSWETTLFVSMVKKNNFLCFISKQSKKKIFIALFIPFFAHCVTGDVLGILMAK